MTRALPADAGVRDLVRYATLAANSHNTQPWRFSSGDGSLQILPDFSRRTAVVDPDDHHLFASLGCAAENLSLAARARGRAGDVRFDLAGDGRALVDLRPAPPRESKLFAAIPLRQCSRVTYDGKAPPRDALERLRGAGSAYGVRSVFIADEKTSEGVLDLVVAGNSRQLDDPAFLAELKAWIRFNPDAAVAGGDGLYAGSTGNPALPSWLGSLLFDLLLRKSAENDKYAEQIRSSAGLVVFVATSDDREGWFDAGRAYQRFALQATVDGLKHAFINQAVEVPEVRSELQSLLGLGDRRPNLVVRYGYGPRMPRSLRRPVSDVVVG